MLYLHKENIVTKKYKCQEIFPTFMSEYLVNLFIFDDWGIDGWYSRHDMSDFPIFYSTSTWPKLPTFMLALTCLYFRLYIFVGAIKTANILCKTILIAKKFQLMITKEKYPQYLC